MDPLLSYFLHALAALAAGLIAWWVACRLCPPEPREDKPLRPGSLVQVDAGDHRGVAGFVRELAFDPHANAELVVVRTQLGDLITCRRDEVSAA